MAYNITKTYKQKEDKMKKSRKRHSRSTGLPISNTNVDVRLRWTRKELGLTDDEARFMRIKLDNKYCHLNPEFSNKL